MNASRRPPEDGLRTITRPHWSQRTSPARLVTVPHAPLPRGLALE